MILDELVLHDFGQYRGRSAIELTPPSAEQPIVLFGGLNGAGKTTLLDAVQLCLFGQLARCSNREGVPYDQYLLSCIHRGGGAEGASIEIAFRHMTDGQEETYNVRRSWRRTGKGCREQLEVLRNGTFDAVATENWAEQVEQFLPARIAHLFLFDGEKVEGYADPKSSAALIETAIYNLLGLDLVEKLDADLLVIERRRKLEVRDDGDKEKIKSAESERDRLQDLVQTTHQRVAELNSKIGRLTARREEVEAKFRKEGGHLYEQRTAIEHEHKAAELELRGIERDLRDISAGALPFLMVAQLLHQVAEQASNEFASKNASTVSKLVSERDQRLLEFISEKHPNDTLISDIHSFLASDQVASHTAPKARYLGMTEKGGASLKTLVDEELEEARNRAQAKLAEFHQSELGFENSKTKLAAIPSVDALAELEQQRSELTQQVSVLTGEHNSEASQLERLRRELERKCNEIERLYQAKAQSAFDKGDTHRVLRHAQKVRDTLTKFKQAMIGRHLKRLETLVLDSFIQLLRKKALVSELSINPHTFDLELKNKNGETITPDRLSAGERQLLAISVLWGLARASGRPLPMIVDTPLGRLDSSHRRRLVSHYFPHASHQVILLSTDEEISGRYYQSLMPYVGRSYQLVHNEELGGTAVKPGYFEEMQNVH